MLGWNKPSATKVLEPTPFEISDAVLRKLGTIWAPIKSQLAADSDTPIGIESYFALAFVNELCDPLEPALMDYAREKDPDAYELALLRSGIFVFLALHIGYLDFSLLNAYRRRFFIEAIGVIDNHEPAPFSIELSELKKWTISLIHSPEVLLISSEHFEHSISRVTQKLKARLLRVRKELTDPESKLAHTYDDGGLGLLRPDEEEEEVGNG
jgi:hypothetical protein